MLSAALLLGALTGCSGGTGRACSSGFPFVSLISFWALWSSFPLRANSTKSVPYFFSAS